MKDVLNLQQVSCYLGPLGTKEARKWTLLAIFPAGEMILTVTYLKEKVIVRTLALLSDLISPMLFSLKCLNTREDYSDARGYLNEFWLQNRI